MTPTIYANRRKRVGAALPDNSLMVLFSGKAPTKSHDEEYPYTPNRNFLYLTGIDRQDMVLVFQKQGEELTETLFIERPEPDKEKWTGYRLRPEAAQGISGIEKIQFTDGFETFLGQQLYNGRYNCLYLDLERLNWEGDRSPAMTFAHELQHRYPTLALKNIHPILAGLRTIKSPEEVDAVREAIQITYEGMDNLIRHAKPGMKEYQMQAYYDFVLCSKGQRDPAFASIIASGKNGVVLHYVENDKTVEDGDLVLLDMGAQSQYYSGDISRTFPANGTFSNRQREIYNIVLKAQQAVIDYAKPGLTLKELNEKTKEVLGSELKRIGLIQNDAELVKYYYHGVSHHLGLDTHDACDSTAPLKPGAVVTVEPGLYIAEEGIGIRIEDDILITATGCEVLSPQIPKSADDVEAWVQQAQK